jgi:hypothetical protein
VVGSPASASDCARKQIRQEDRQVSGFSYCVIVCIGPWWWGSPASASDCARKQTCSHTGRIHEALVLVVLCTFYRVNKGCNQ